MIKDKKKLIKIRKHSPPVGTAGMGNLHKWSVDENWLLVISFNAHLRNKKNFQSFNTLSGAMPYMRSKDDIPYLI